MAALAVILQVPEFMVSVSAVEKRSIWLDRQHGRGFPGHSDSGLTATGSRLSGGRVPPKLRWASLLSISHHSESCGKLCLKQRCADSFVARSVWKRRSNSATEQNAGGNRLRTSDASTVDSKFDPIDLAVTLQPILSTWREMTTVLSVTAPIELRARGSAT